MAPVLEPPDENVAALLRDGYDAVVGGGTSGMVFPRIKG